MGATSGPRGRVACHPRARSLPRTRESASKRTRPGLCIDCYFRLHQTADAGGQHALVPLRSWLESNVEVVAKDPKSRIIEKLPLQLDTADLAAYCHRIMGDFREDRAYLHSQVTLEFQYKEAA